MPDNYQRGDNLTWTTLESGYNVRRPVEYISAEGDGNHAIVSLGRNHEGAQRRQRVLKTELSFPTPEKRPDWLSEQFKPPKPPTPPTTEQLQTSLANARVTLAEKHTTLRDAEHNYQQSQHIVNRANAELAGARAVVAKVDASDNAARIAVENAIRQGTPPPEHRNGVDREALRNRVTLLESAERNFQQELHAASLDLAAAKSAVSAASVTVIVAFIAIHAEHLRTLEADAASMRAMLVTVSEWRPPGYTNKPIPLTPAATHVIGSPLPWDENIAARSGSNARRIEPFQRLYERLISDEIDAELEI